MRVKTKVVAAVTSVLGLAGSAGAVVVAGSDATYGTGSGAAWTNVGSVGGASGVYVGNGWVITARHVGGGTFISGDISDPMVGSQVQIYEPDENGHVTSSSPTTDLVMFKLAFDPGLPTLKVATSSPTVGTAVTMVGYGTLKATGPEVSYGVQKGTNPDGSPNWTWTSHATAQAGDYSGYALTSGGTKRWGTATTAGFSYQGSTYDLGEFQAYSYAGDGGLVTYFATNYGGEVGDAQAVSGDSGGGVFAADGTLLGIMDAAIGSQPGNPGASLPNQPNGTVFGDPSSTVNLDVDYAANTTTFITDIATYYPQIAAIAGFAVIAPEPACLAPIAAIGLVALRRHRR